MSESKRIFDTNDHDTDLIPTDEHLNQIKLNQSQNSPVRNRVGMSYVSRDNSRLSYYSKRSQNFTFGEFSKQMSFVVFPGMLFYICVILHEAINLAYIGQSYNNDDMIKGIGISHLYMNCTMFAVVHGLISSIDTLCSNALAAKKRKLMGIYVHRARIIGYSVTAIIVIIHVFTVDKVLKFFNLNEKVVNYSLKYIYTCLLYIFFDVQTGCNFRYLNVIGKSHVNMIVMIISIILHPLWNYIFITVLNLDVTGAAISFLMSRFIICLFISLYIHIWNPCPESYFCINRECFNGLGDYFSFSIGVALIFCAEWWAMEIQAIIAIFLSEDDYTVHIIISQFFSLLYSLDAGLAFAVSVQIANYIVKAPVRVTKKILKYSLLFGFICMIILLSFFFYFRIELFSLFINKANLVKKATPVLLVLCIALIFDNFQTITCAALRGLGKSFGASIFTFIQFYIIMTSVSFILGNVVGLGVLGIWIGVVIGNASACVFYMILFLCLDLEKIKIETKIRLENDEKNALIFNHSAEFASTSKEIILIPAENLLSDSKIRQLENNKSTEDLAHE